MFSRNKATLLRDSYSYLQLSHRHLLCIGNVREFLFLSHRGPYRKSFHSALSLPSSPRAAVTVIIMTVIFHSLSSILFCSTFLCVETFLNQQRNAF
jgi:hypothetical protein